MRKMKFAWVFFLLVAALISACDNNSANPKIEKTRKENCVFPQNPYNDGGGHDAGFNWTAENGGSCDGNSDSFNEGCIEYYNQLNRYNNCIASNR
jgi:hypothetical protein